MGKNALRYAPKPRPFGNLVACAPCYDEAYKAWQARTPLIKVYPVAEMGGVDYIKDMIKPMPFLNLMPCGYVKLTEIKDYLQAGATAVGVGRELYDKNNFSEIVKTVKEVKKMIK